MILRIDDKGKPDESLGRKTTGLKIGAIYASRVTEADVVL